MLHTSAFFDLSHFAHAALFHECQYVWDGLNALKNYLASYPFSPFFAENVVSNVPLEKTLVLHQGDILDATDLKITFGDTTKGKLAVYRGDQLLTGASVLMAGACFAGDRIELGTGVLVETGTLVKSPVIIGDCTEIRQGAYLRGDIITGRGCVLGHTTEIKHSVFLNDAKAGHFNYIGDSILGNNTNLGAGTKFANLRFIEGNIFIEHEKDFIDTGRRKIGAILGDNTQTGCNSVTNPGTLIGKDSFVMPNSTARAGYHGPGTIIR